MLHVVFQRVIAERLRLARKAARLSQEEVAFRAGLDRGYVSQVERGHKSPTLATFWRLCEAMDVQPERIIANLAGKMPRTDEEAYQSLERLFEAASGEGTTFHAAAHAEIARTLYRLGRGCGESVEEAYEHTLNTSFRVFEEDP